MEQQIGTILELEAEHPTKTGNFMHILKFSDGEKYSAWGKAPDDLKKAYADKATIEIGYVVKDGYRNIKMVNYSVAVDEDKQEKLKQDGTMAADPVDGMDDKLLLEIVHEGEEIMAQCRDAITRVLNREPVKDGEPAMVNSLFIYVTKELYFRKNGGRK